MKNSFAVAGRFEEFRAKDRSQILMIIDLSIGDKHFSVRSNGLAAILLTDDRQPAMAHHGRSPAQSGDLGRIGAAMSKA